MIGQSIRPIGKVDRTTVAGIWAVGLVLGFLGGAGCQTEEPQGSSTVEPTRGPDQQIHDFALTETEDGRKLWVLNAQVARIFDSSNEIALDTLGVDFFGEREEHVSRLTSDHGTINRTTRNMEAFGHVVIVTDDGLRLETEEVQWVNREGEIVSDAPVRFTRGRSVLTGVGFVSKPSLENIEIREQIEAEVLEPDANG